MSGISLTFQVVTQVPAEPMAGCLYLVKPVADDKFHLAWLGVDGETVYTTLKSSDIASEIQDAINEIEIIADTADRLSTPRNINGVAFDGSQDIEINAVDSTSRIATSQKGAANGVATLDVNSEIPVSQLPTIDKAYVGLGSVDNTADTNKVVLSASKLTIPRTINGVSFDGTENITINAVDSTARIAASEKGVANGVATLDNNGLVLSSQLPSYVDDVIEAANFATLPVTGESGKIYVTLDDNKQYRWSGSAYVIINAGDVLPVAGKKGVVTLVKGDVGLGNVDNTADSVKSVLSATKLTTARSISATGDASWTVSFDGSGAATAALTLATVNASAVTASFSKVTTNGKGLVTATTPVLSTDITSALGFTPVNKTGDTMTGNLTVAPAAGSAEYAVDVVDGQQAAFTLKSAGKNRWKWSKTATSESGGNVGSDLNLNRYDDTGTFIDSVISIVRSTGRAIFNKIVKFADSVLIGTDTVYNGAALTVNGRASGSDPINDQDFVTRKFFYDTVVSAAGGQLIQKITSSSVTMIKDRLNVIKYEDGPVTLVFPTEMSPGDNFWILNITDRADHVLDNNGHLLQGFDETQFFNMKKKCAQYKYIGAAEGLYLMN